jgi:hypothetical protein
MAASKKSDGSVIHPLAIGLLIAALPLALSLSERERD